MKTFLHFLVNFVISFFKMFALRRKSENIYGKFDNGGLEPPCSPTGKVVFKSY